MSRARSGAASAALAAVLVGVALGARGGSDLERTGIVELALLALGTLLVGAALLRGRRGPLYGGWTLAAFAALAVLTGLSVSWSIAPDLSYAEASRTLAYLAAFAGALALARLDEGGGPVVARAIVAAAVAIAGFALATRVWPGHFDEVAFGGRLGQPFDYWNALAGVTAIGVVPGLWFGARRNGSRLGRVLAYPAVGLLIATLLITQSRGGLAAAAIATALWLAIVPLRLRSLTVFVPAAAAAGPVAAWALSKDPFKVGLQTLAEREAVAGDFGLLLATLTIALVAVGLAVEALASRRRPSLQARKRAGVAVAVAVALVSLALVATVTTSDRGLTGTISDRFDELTSDTAAPPTGGARLASVSSERGGYWREAFDTFDEQPLAGLGAGSFELARLAHRNDGGSARRAHGFTPQTAADLGLLGLLATFALLAAWLAAAARTTGLGPRQGRPRPAWTAERSALVALSLAVVAYGIQSFADWTWFVPGVTVMALVAAGFVAGQGPPSGLGERLRPSGPRVVLVAGSATIALLCGWAIWQPIAADRSVQRSYALIDAGQPAAAIREAVHARDLDPRSNEPLYAIATAFVDGGRPRAALTALRQASSDHPRDPDPLLRSATIQLDTLDEPESALVSITKAIRLDPYSIRLAAFRDRANVTRNEHQLRKGAGAPSTP